MIAYYMRLSSADEENGTNSGSTGQGRYGRESGSIDSQRLTLMNYQRRHPDIGQFADILQHLEYIDDGFTGRNFKRPGWNRLIEDCKKGKVDTILVKDASRLGRNHIEVENYLQMVFPALEVRVICVDGGYDSKVSTTGEAVSFQNIINDWYSRDISLKIRSSLHQIWKSGEMANVQVPFGYVCRDRKKGCEVDPEAAKVVKRIFAEASEGKTTRMIMDGLNRDGIPDPYSYLIRRDGRKSRFDEKTEMTRVWTTGTVRNILRNESYTGVRISHRTTTSRTGKAIQVPEEEQFRFEDDHEPLVSRELFEKAAEVIGKRTMKVRSKAAETEETSAVGGGSRSSFFQGFLRCGNCHRMMPFSGLSYRCNNGRMSQYTGCSEERFREVSLKSQVWTILREKATKARQILEGQEIIPVADGIEEEIRIWKYRQMDAFAEMSSGLITTDDFIRIRDETRKMVSELEQKRSEIAEKNGYRIDLEYALKPLAKAETKTELTREMLQELVETIYVFEDQVEVVTRAEKYLINKE